MLLRAFRRLQGVQKNLKTLGTPRAMQNFLEDQSAGRHRQDAGRNGTGCVVGIMGGGQRRRRPRASPANLATVIILRVLAADRLGSNILIMSRSVPWGRTPFRLNLTDAPPLGRVLVSCQPSLWAERGWPVRVSKCGRDRPRAAGGRSAARVRHHARRCAGGSHPGTRPCAGRWTAWRARLP